MRKIGLVSSFLIFLLSFNIYFAKNFSFAQEPISSESARLQLPEHSDGGQAEKIDYELPYPGLLPDNPLYFLKMVRDRVVSLLISDPRKKAEFDLLQSDKRLNAGVYLFNKKKFKDAVSIVSKAENYFEQALQKTKEAKAQGMKTSEMTNKLINSSKKHKEVLKSLEEKSPQNFKSNFNIQLQRVDKFVEEISD